MHIIYNWFKLEHDIFKIYFLNWNWAPNKIRWMQNWCRLKYRNRKPGPEIGRILNRTSAYQSFLKYLIDFSNKTQTIPKEKKTIIVIFHIWNINRIIWKRNDKMFLFKKNWIFWQHIKLLNTFAHFFQNSFSQIQFKRTPLKPYTRIKFSVYFFFIYGKQLP